MAEETDISWADATLNFWIGCTKVSLACDFCYAEGWGKRFGVKWGPGEIRRLTVDWIRKVRALERRALAKLEATGEPFFCFSNSLSDFFDKEVPAEVRRAAFAAMREAPHVTFLLLTKRPGMIVKLFTEALDSGDRVMKGDDATTLSNYWPRNAAIGCTVVNQEEVDRDIPKLLQAKAILKPAFAFVSMEPLLGPVDIRDFMWPVCAQWPAPYRSPQEAKAVGAEVIYHRQALVWAGAQFLDWVITGGESGAHARHSHPDWFRSLRDQCAAAGVAFHFKQWGEYEPNETGHPILGGNTPRSTTTFVSVRFPDGTLLNRVGKKAAGRLLDGALHDARPKVPA